MYGIDIATLDKFITLPEAKKETCGSFTRIVDVPEYRLERYVLISGASVPFEVSAKFDTTLSVEEGAVSVEALSLGRHELTLLPPGAKGRITAKEASVVYMFSGAPSPAEYGKKLVPTDHRDKYWGEIESIISRENYAAKRMVVKKSGAASLEYHCRKLETYFIHSGKLLLRNRAGRGEDRFFTLEAGSAVLTPPGLMHQRGGLEDTVIIEISTKDEDSDSFLVEDGAKIRMPQLP